MTHPHMDPFIWLGSERPRLNDRRGPDVQGPDEVVRGGYIIPNASRDFGSGSGLLTDGRQYSYGFTTRQGRLIDRGPPPVRGPWQFQGSLSVGDTVIWNQPEIELPAVIPYDAYHQMLALRSVASGGILPLMLNYMATFSKEPDTTRPGPDVPGPLIPGSPNPEWW